MVPVPARGGTEGIMVSVPARGGTEGVIVSVPVRGSIPVGARWRYGGLVFWHSATLLSGICVISFESE